MKNQKTPKIQVKIKIPREAALVLEALAEKRGLALKAYIVAAIGDFCARGGGQAGSK